MSSPGILCCYCVRPILTPVGASPDARLFLERRDAFSVAAGVGSDPVEEEPEEHLGYCSPGCRALAPTIEALVLVPRTPVYPLSAFAFLDRREAAVVKAALALRDTRGESVLMNAERVRFEFFNRLRLRQRDKSLRAQYNRRALKVNLGGVDATMRMYRLASRGRGLTLNTFFDSRERAYRVRISGPKADHLDAVGKISLGAEGEATVEGRTDGHLTYTLQKLEKDTGRNRLVVLEFDAREHLIYVFVISYGSSETADVPAESRIAQPAFPVGALVFTEEELVDYDSDEEEIGEEMLVGPRLLTFRDPKYKLVSLKDGLTGARGFALQSLIAIDMEQTPQQMRHAMAVRFSLQTAQNNGIVSLESFGRKLGMRLDEDDFNVYIVALTSLDEDVRASTAFDATAHARRTRALGRNAGSRYVVLFEEGRGPSLSAFFSKRRGRARVLGFSLSRTQDSVTKGETTRRYFDDLFVRMVGTTEDTYARFAAGERAFAARLSTAQYLVFEFAPTAGKTAADATLARLYLVNFR